MKTILPYIVAVLAVFALGYFMFYSPYFKPVKHTDPSDQKIKDLYVQLSDKEDSIADLKLILSDISDSFIRHQADYNKKPFREIVKVFIDRTHYIDTSQSTLLIDSFQVDACNRCFMALDSNRAVVKTQSEIIKISQGAIGACKLSGELISDQLSDCREDVENWERLYNLKWWQIFKRMNLKRKLR